MAKKPEKSPAVQLLDIVWENVCDQTSHSWERTNHSMRDALRLAIGAGMRFDIGDVGTFGTYRWNYWIGDDGGEHEYTLAITCGNATFCEAFEQHMERKPFRAYGVDYRQYSSYTHGGFSRQRDRLGIGMTFDYAGVRPKVTSFSKDGETIVACTYRREPYNGSEYEREKLDKRFKLSRDDIAADHKDMEWKTAIKDGKGCVPMDRAKEFADALGVKDTLAFLQLPRKKIEAAIKKLGIVEAA